MTLQGRGGLARLIGAGVLAVILQASVVPWLRVLGAGPDLPLVLVIYLGLFYGDKGMETVILAGLLMGLAVDQLSLGPLGLNAATKVLLGLLTGFFSLRIFPENRWVQIGMTASAMVLQEVLFLLAARVFLDLAVPRTNSLLHLLGLALWGTVSALLLLPFLHAWLGGAGGTEGQRRSESLAI